MFIPFGQWRPDSAELNSGNVGDISNVLCSDNSYIPFPALSAFSAALASAPRGRGFLARSLSGQITIFVGTATKLYVMDNTDATWSDVSQASTTYSATETAPWSFAQFGDYVIAVNENDDPQVYELGVSSAFADLGGSPPRAAVVKVWGDFLALMGLADNPDRVHWSGLNDITEWTPGTNSSDYQTFPDGGRIQGSTESTNPLIFLERAIYKATFVPGSVEIFTFQKIHDRRGAASADSISSRGNLAFYADSGGFFQIAADGSLAPIGLMKIDRTIFGAMTSGDARSVMGAIDPFYSRVYWALRVGTADTFNRLLVYDWDLAKWSIASVSIQSVFPMATTGYTLESLASISASLDALPFSLDAKAWQGGAPLLGAMDISNKMGFFNGYAMEATITTQEMGDTGDAMTTITSVRPVVDASTCSVSIGSRNTRAVSPTWTAESTPSTNTGRVRKKSRGRFHSIKVRIPAGQNWSHAQGVDPDIVKTGLR